VSRELCECGEGDFNPDEYNRCYGCFLERRTSYENCILCGLRRHSPNYSCCFQCRSESPKRDEAARRLRLDILVRDNFTCLECGSQDSPQVDHIKPCAAHGLATPWNLQVLCAAHNREKGAYWKPGSVWDAIRVRLMHTYLTYGWSMLDEPQRDQLVADAAIYGEEFTWHVNFNGKPVEPSQWAIDYADTNHQGHGLVACMPAGIA
jgi:5-methylcytosine-specific restriction endonuclease McrA